MNRYNNSVSIIHFALAYIKITDTSMNYYYRSFMHYYSIYCEEIRWSSYEYFLLNVIVF